MEKEKAKEDILYIRQPKSLPSRKEDRLTTQNLRPQDWKSGNFQKRQEYVKKKQEGNHTS